MLRLILFIFIFTSITNADDKEYQKTIKTVEVTKVYKGKLSSTVKLPGKITAKKFSNLNFKQDGIIEKIYINSGQQVKKNTLIATLQPYKAISNIEKIDQKQLARAQQLLNQKIITTNNFEEINKTVLNNIEKIQKISLIAPFDGIIGVFKAYEGQEISSKQHIVSIYNYGELLIEINIPESILGYIKPAQPAFINEKLYYINNIDPFIDETNLMGAANINYSCDKCIIGSTVDVDLTVEAKEDILIIPYSAVFYRDKIPYVYLIDKDNNIISKQITLGLRSKHLIEVISGLKLDDIIVSYNTNRLSDGDKVQIYTGKEL
jgi:membrane fusion protein (multidrug efflux system)